MLIKIGDLWDYYKLGRWIIITTNGTVKKDGTCVMGKGVAEEAKNMFPNLPHELGDKINAGGNHVYIFDSYRIITFPTKDNWRTKSNLSLIENSLKELVAWADKPHKHGKFYLPRVGCGYGKLDWNVVRPLCTKYLDDRFVVVWK